VKASFLTEHGDIDKIRYDDLPDPVPGPGQVRVRVRAGAINHLDIFVRIGIPGISLAMPHVMGSDGAGVVDVAGPGVTRVKPGDEVVLNPGIHCGTCEFCLRGEHSLCVTFHLLGEHIWGTFAEYVVAPEINAYPKPQELTWEESAAFPLTFLTAWRMLVTKGKARPGESLLIIGIGGGVSLAALQIAKRIGLTVGVTSGNAEKLRHAEEWGADFGINHGTGDFSRETRPGRQTAHVRGNDGPEPGRGHRPDLLEPADGDGLHDGNTRRVLRDAPDVLGGPGPPGRRLGVPPVRSKGSPAAARREETVWESGPTCRLTPGEGVSPRLQ
jgi:NADPH:quinone reductase-like Zn-dependent oxidoreductase